MEGERRGQGSSVCVEGGKERTGKGGGGEERERWREEGRSERDKREEEN